MRDNRTTLVLLSLGVFHFASILPIIRKIVTWVDPAWYTYNAFDMYYGRPIGTNLELARLFYTTGPHSICFFVHDYTATPLWPFVNYLFFKVFGPSLVVSRTISATVMFLAAICLFRAIRSHLADNNIALLAVSLFVVDYTVFWASTSARPDAMCAFLAIAGIYFFLRFLDDRGKVVDGAIAGILFFCSIITFPLAAAIPLAISIVMISTLGFRRLTDRQALAKFWPLGFGFLILIVWAALNFKGVASWTRLAVSRAPGDPNFFLSLLQSLYLEVTYKFGEAYGRRYQLLTIIVFLSSIAFLLARFKELKPAERQALGFTVTLFLVIAVFDTTHSKGHLILETPFISLIISVALYRVYREYKRLSRFAAVLAVALLINPLLPRAAKYYQVWKDPTGTSYERYANFVREKVPRGSKILGSCELIWGLHDMGYRIVQLHYIRPDYKKYLKDIDYIITYSPMDKSWDKYVRELAKSTEYEFEERGAIGQDCTYCYHAVIYKMTASARK